MTLFATRQEFDDEIATKRGYGRAEIDMLGEMDHAAIVTDRKQQRHARSVVSTHVLPT
jgi:hypothetical protein